jgi:hypothetical protein
MATTEEFWIDIPGFEGLYQASNWGRIKSLKYRRSNQENLMTLFLESTGYYKVPLQVGSKSKYFRVHQLIAMAFFGHVPCGYDLVINHINHIKIDNRPENLEITTNRINCDRKHIPSSSKYVGVYFLKKLGKWKAQINIKGKQYYLGVFTKEDDAHFSYETALLNIKQPQYEQKQKKN